MSHYIPPTHEHEIDPLEGRGALLKGSPSFHEVTEAVARPIEFPAKVWWIAFLAACSVLGVLGISIAWLFWEGVGIWGNNIPVGWGWPIVNFVFWVGIGHAGTLISAVLFLFRQKWRTSINRASEAMTIFAVICALLFPTIHVGRVWVIYWPLPIPNQMQMWPNFRSPLLWDVFAVSTYFTVSLLFWYVGLIPDIATMRDRAKTKIRRLAYGVFALGWRGSARHWLNYEAAYLLLAAMATPLVLSVHSIVSFDFAVSQLPGWHTTIFPPYFVAGAIFSGFGMVLTLMIPLRKWFRLEHIIGIKHLENMAKIILVTGSLVGYAYSMEFFIAWYSGNPYESFLFVNRAFGDYSWAYWIMVSCNVLSPQFIWIKRIRRSPAALFILSIFVNIGMWFERFVIVASSLHHDFLPSSWDYFSPTPWDWATLIGSFGLFFTLFLLFLRFLPVIAMAEVKAVLPYANPHYHDPNKPPRRSHGVTSGEMDSRHDLDDDDEPASPDSSQSTSGSAKVVVSSEFAAYGEVETGIRKKREIEAKAKAEEEAKAKAEEEAKAKEEAAHRSGSADAETSGAKEEADSADAETSGADDDVDDSSAAKKEDEEKDKDFLFSPPKSDKEDKDNG
jgi:molybdopterin-containing oxidoreductase family membrane subunit